MHEMAIAQSLADILRQEIAKRNLGSITTVRVKYGRLSTVVPDALTFSFEILAQGTELEGAVLEMEEIPIRVRCRACAGEFTPEEESLIYMPCPRCGEEFGHEILTGKELYIDSIETDEGDPS